MHLCYRGRSCFVRFNYSSKLFGVWLYQVYFFPKIIAILLVSRVLFLHNYSSLVLFSIFLIAFMLQFINVSSLRSLSVSVSDGLLSDEISLFLVFMSLYVIAISFVYSSKESNHSGLSLVLFVIFLPCFFVFTVDNSFFLYLFYEISLLPILYIILKWGSYPDRSLRAVMLLLYTSILAFPLLGVIFYSGVSEGSFSLSCLSMSSPSLRALSTIILFLAFSVKLPIYGLHFWLPIAHVEAPTFGSIILAGILLKLGGAGLLRFSFMLDLDQLKYLMISYFVVFFMMVCLICRFQSDFKRLVAYSSVSHMMAIPILLIRRTLISSKSLVLVMFFHGFRSPILFMLVGLVYNYYSTRQLALVRGLLTISPLLSFFMVVSFLFTLSAPPYPSFFAEVILFIRTVYMSMYFLPFFIIFIFLSLVYNLNWLCSLSFSSASSPNYSFSFSFLWFLPLASSHILAFLTLLLIPLF